MLSLFIFAIVKVRIFWEGLKILRNLHLTFDLCSASQIRLRFRKILWPSQNIWTLRDLKLALFSSRESVEWFHLQNGINYSIGSFHFFRESEWEKCCGVVAAPEGSFIYGKKSSWNDRQKNRFDVQKWPLRQSHFNVKYVGIFSSAFARSN